VHFAQEFWLFLVPLVPLLWLVFRAADRRTAKRLELLLGPDARSHVEGVNLRLQGWRRFFFLAGIFWLLLALARPQWGANEVTVTQRGSDIVIALDISNSMLAEDVLPNRMGRAITELTSFLNRLEDSRIGLVFFAGSAFVQCPLTLDYGTAEIFLKMAGPDMMSQQGTAIAGALETSRNLLNKGRGESEKNNFQAILLVTDGEDLEGKWEEQAEACKSDGIKVIPVGVGDKGGGLIPAFDLHGRPDGFMKDDEGNVVMTRLDLVSLEKLAGIGGGSSFLIGVDGLAGDRLFAELQRLGKRDLEDRRISAYQERYMWPLMMALLCFVLRMVLHSRRPNRPGGAFPSSAVMLSAGLVFSLLMVSDAQAGLRPAGGREAMQAREFYMAGDFEKALEKFEEALIQAPEDPVISLALGETLHHLERYEEAGVEFERALGLSDDPQIKAEALYNRGTTRLAAGQTDKAAEDLLASLQWDPDQSDARHNLEVALRRLQQQQQQEQEQQDQNKDDQQKQDEEKQDQENQENKDGDQENQEQQQEQDQNQEQDQQKPEENKDQQDQQDQQQDKEKQQQEDQQQDQNDSENPDEMTKEQALQLLQALDRDEEELKRSVQKRLQGGRPKSGKKW